MRQITLFPLVLGLALSVASSFAAPPPGGGRPGYGGGGARPGYGGGWAPVHRPGYGYGGWYGGWRGYPYYGLGLGFGLGYGAGWAYSSYPGYYWGAPYYGAYPYGYVVSTAPAPGWNDEVVYVQQSQTISTNPQPQQPATGSWYYCTAPAGYYPYVQQCSRPWVEVQPPPAPPPQ